MFFPYHLVYYVTSFLFEERLWGILRKNGFMKVIAKSRLLR